MAWFPNVQGAIDGTHIPIIRATVDEHLYVNRKRVPSTECSVCMRFETPNS